MYERLRDFLLSKRFMMGKVDTTLFIKKIVKDLFRLQIYVDDIIFESTNQDFYEEFLLNIAYYKSWARKHFAYYIIGQGVEGHGVGGTKEVLSQTIMVPGCTASEKP